MIWLLEKPLLIVAVGLVTAAVFGGIWIQTGRRATLYGLWIVLATTGALLLLERLVETDREQIEATLHRIAACVERNDIEGALRFAHSAAPEIRREAEAELPRYNFEQVTIKPNLQIRLRHGEEPATAIAEFNVMVVLSDRSGFLQNRRIPRFVVVTFQKEGDAWRVVDYEHHEPSQGFLQRSADRKRP